MRKTELFEFYQQILDKGFSIRIPYQGTSMRPFLRLGDQLIIKHAKPEQLAIGEILIFFNGHNLVVHRLIQKCKQHSTTRLLTKGDNNLTADRPILPEYCLGRLSKLERRGKCIDLETAAWRIVNIFLAYVSIVKPLIYKIKKHARCFAVRVKKKVKRCLCSL